MTRDELYCQSLNDLLRATIVLLEILETKELTKADEERVRYGTKLLHRTTERQIKIIKTKDR